jgi:hypothetical protein
VAGKVFTALDADALVFEAVFPGAELDGERLNTEIDPFECILPVDLGSQPGWRSCTATIAPARPPEQDVGVVVAAEFNGEIHIRVRLRIDPCRQLKYRRPFDRGTGRRQRQAK